MKIAIFEGPPVEKRCPGWRHYMYMFFPDGRVITRQSVGTRQGAERMAATVHASLYDFGKWELSHDYSAGFPAPSPAVLAEIQGKKEMELGL